jgi:hypothetical protein
VTPPPPKPRKKDFVLVGDFMRASAEWAEKYNHWPWGGPRDEDDDYFFEVVEPSTGEKDAR